MTHTDHFQDEVDRLDSGLPDTPDLRAIRVAGARQRRRRRQVQALAGGALVALLAAPVAVLTGTGSGTDGETGSPVSEGPAVDSPADASFGAGMRAAVLEAFPQARERADQESLGDRWVWRDATNLDWEVGEPPRWATLFAWAQHYEVDGIPLSVVATREPARPTVDPAEAGYCRDGLYVVEKQCSVREVGGRVVVVHEGTRVVGQDPDTWGIDVEVHGADGTERYASLTRVGTLAAGDGWAAARAEMPDADSLVALAVDGRLVLPEPERYPRQFPPNRPQG